MNHEANAVLEQAKQVIANPQPKTEAKQYLTSEQLPNFSTMSVTDAVRWCKKNGIEKPQAIANLTGKPTQSIYTALWKIRHPKRSKRLNRESKARREGKLVVAVKKTKPTTIKTSKPKIENGLYDDGMETPMFDAIMRRGVSGFVKPRSLDLAKEWLAEKNESDLMAENRRLKILVDHYETLLFKGGK